MSTTMHITDNQEALLDYLYEEGNPDERVKIAQHLLQCAPCSVAVLELQSVRGLLAEWTPPAAVLGFKVVQGDAAPPVQPLPLPVQKGSGSLFWAQAAAAVLLFAAGMGASQLHVQYSDGSLTIGTRAGQPPAMAEAPVVHSGTDILLPPEFANASSAPGGSVERVGFSSRAASADEVLNKVKALIDQSESRQQHELALRLQDVVHDFDAQRDADMRHVDQNLGQLEGQTAAETARNRAMVNSLLKVSQGGVR